MAAPTANIAAKQGVRALRSDRMQGALGCLLLRQTLTTSTRALGISSAPAPVNSSTNYCHHAARNISTGRVLHSSANKERTLEDFSEELNVEEKPQRYKAWAPADDVYMIAHYPPKQVPFKEAIEQLRTQAYWKHLPERPYNTRHLELSVHLNMNTGEKPLPAFAGMFVPPHGYQGANKVVCIAEGEDAKRAEEAGASLVIGTSDFPGIESEEILMSEYKYCVASKSLLPQLPKIKTYLRDKYPSLKKGSAGDNIEEIVQRYLNIKTYRVSEPQNRINHCAIGELGLSDEQIEDNIKVFLNDILTHSPSPHEPFITKVSLKGFRLSSYQLQFQDYLPKVTERKEKVDQRSELERIEDELAKLRAS